MKTEPLRLTDLAHELVRLVLRPGDAAIDATAGNGHDTLFLAQAVGVTGHVFSFDIQAEAIVRTRQRLAEAKIENVTLHQASHARMGESVTMPIRAVMFNLGYLPGGDKSVITSRDSTLVALESAKALLQKGGILTVLAYRGHPGGMDEAQAARECVSSWNGSGIRVEERGEVGDHASPILLVAWKS